MKPSELYRLVPAEVDHDLHVLERFMDGEVDFFAISESGREVYGIEVRYYADEYDAGGERCWTLCSVWFHGQPFMACQLAGRGGRDHKECFITDWPVYRQVVEYLRLLYEQEEKDERLRSAEEDIPELTTFYGSTLSLHYDPDLRPKYKVGDVVMAGVPENHLRYPPGRCYTRVRIDRVRPFNPGCTYQGSQLDRRWEEGGHRRIVLDVNNGRLGARFTDKDVLGLVGPCPCGHPHAALVAPDGRFVCLACLEKDNAPHS